MPSISVAGIALALKAILAMVFVGATGVAVVDFANDYILGSAGTPFPAAVLYQTVQFRSDMSTAPCYTCQQLWDIQPSPALPLKILYAAPKVHSKPTPTPPPTTTRKATSGPATSFSSRVINRSHGASTLAASSTWNHNLFRYLASFVFALASSAPLVIVCKIILLLSLMVTPAYLIPRRDSFQRCLQLLTKTKDTLGKVMATILLSFHKPEMLLSTGMYKARINGTPNLESRRPRKVHADIPTAFYEQYLFATADIGPSFGPSTQNAETEFRSLLERVEGNIGKQADIVTFFRKTLDSFTRALVAAEATTEGRNIRYMTVIEDQDRLIDELRMLHEYREQAFQGKEDIIELLCCPNRPKHPSDKYSTEYDKFIIPPLDDPATLSMKVSVRSAPFHRRPVTILDSDPHWQRFLESTADKGSEQEARLASYEDDFNKWDEKRGEAVNKWDKEEGDDVNKCAEEEGDDVNKCAEIEGGDVQDGYVPGTCDLSDDGYHDMNELGDDVTVNDTESPNEEMKVAQSNLAWFEWKLACMNGSQGTSRVSNLQQLSVIPPDVPLSVMNEIAEIRCYQEQSWAESPKQPAIRDCESSIDTLIEKIACMKKNATSEVRTRKGRKGVTLPEPTTAGESPLPGLGLKPNKRSNSRQRARAKGPKQIFNHSGRRT